MAGTVLASVVVVEKFEMYGRGPAASAGAVRQTKPAKLAPQSAIASRVSELRRWARVTIDKASPVGFGAVVRDDARERQSFLEHEIVTRYGYSRDLTAAASGRGSSSSARNA